MPISFLYYIRKETKCNGLDSLKIQMVIRTDCKKNLLLPSAAFDCKHNYKFQCLPFCTEKELNLCHPATTPTIYLFPYKAAN